MSAGTNTRAVSETLQDAIEEVAEALDIVEGSEVAEIAREALAKIEDDGGGR